MNEKRVEEIVRELLIEIELVAGMDGDPDAAASIAAALRESLGLTVPLRVVAAGTLPRFEMKAQRFIISPT